MRPLPRRPGRRRDPRGAAGWRGVARGGARLRRAQREQARRHARPRRAGRSRATARAARVGGRLDRDDAARDARAARARRRRRAGAQPATRHHVDHRLRPERRLPRLGGQRRDPGGAERDPEPLGAGRPRSTPAPARDGVRDDRDPGRLGDARRLLEPPARPAAATTSTSRSSRLPSRSWTRPTGRPR